MRPGASRPGVGGSHDGVLLVRVAERADGGKATEASLRALAAALGLPRQSVSLARGASSRRKLVEVEAAEADVLVLTERLAALRAIPGD